METKQRIDSESNRSGPSLDLNESSLAGAPGDVDLVARVLDQDSEGLKTAAIAAVRAHAGIPDADWAKRLDLVPGGHAKVAVECRGQQLGVLHAPRPISVDQLQPWASWLGWWLALDKQSQQLTHDSTHDDLTGLCNRRHFRQFLESILHKATSERFHVTLLVFDLDEFKTYNDRFGHAAGDEILRETARLIQSSVREHDVVARIGGDEFAVVFWDRAGPRRPNSQHPNDVLRAAERFRKAICGHRFPKLGAEAPGALTVSAGLAGFPWDGRTPEELLDKADQMALRSKRQGKNAISLGPGAARHCKVPKT